LTQSPLFFFRLRLLVFVCTSIDNHENSFESINQSSCRDMLFLFCPLSREEQEFRAAGIAFVSNTAVVFFHSFSLLWTFFAIIKVMWHRFIRNMRIFFFFF
jgi:hypothetical protein